ncbi:CocE/NonD family hydrolase [Fulvivirgaceae bacterium PWU4]|uniref:CocE/NonD family hydrolase n=1 Tax=Chryseosolibacter histidini TaxID=2782349 RepID=A0AAP2DIS4_9BACT|nr:CocE/NonD family hydrolase [Chryseosolibacter histidini]MBT1697126.1 CocE/NonD family hydrolase [Chryseosolibacter histidini]
MFTRSLFLFFILSSACAAQGQKQSYKVIENVRIKLDDGTQLAGHLSYPASGERVPVLFRFNCYARLTDLAANAFIFQLATNLGYAYAEIYTRGSGGSTGSVAPFEHDAGDVRQVIDWLSKQTWCNGEVAMGGGSYLGYTQWAAMKNPHPALKTIVPMVAAAPGKDFPILNGISMNYSLRWLSFFGAPYVNDNTVNDSVAWRQLYNAHYRQGLRSLDLDSLKGKRNATYQQWLAHPTFDSYWSSKLPSAAEFRKINIPVLSITGYFDSDQRGAMYYYNMHQRNNPDNRHYLLIGPYDHFTGQNAKHFSRYHYYRFDSIAYVNKVMLSAQWYNHVLKNGPMPEVIKDRVNVYVIGDGWRHAPSLSAMAKDTLKFHIGKESLSVKRQPASVLPLKFDARSIADTLGANYTYRGALSFNDEFPLPVDGNENYLRQTPLLIFDSPVFEKPFDLIGSPVATLYLSATDIRDADIELQYYEVTAEGKSYPLSLMTQRLSMADDRKKQLLKEREVRRFHLDNAYFMGKRIAKGSRIRLTFRIINEAATQKNYGSGKDVFKETRRDAKTGLLKIHSGHSYHSSVYIPGSSIGQ